VSDELQLTTSPLLFAYRGPSGRLVALDARRDLRFRLTGSRAAQIITALLEPRSIDSAEAEGFSAEEIDEAREVGLIVSEDEFDGLELWERNGWSRPAYLLFSQMDIPYREALDGAAEKPEMTRRRRGTVEQYQEASPYVEPEPLARGPAVELPEPPAIELTLSALTTRRSARGFPQSPPSALQMAGVLHTATESQRAVAADRAGGDPFRLLNSFFSWAHLFVAVQDVEGVPRGTYEYDWREHRLLEAADPPTDEGLLASVQGQRGILGTGFVVFLVADLRGYAWLYRHSRAYIHLLIQVGELGQEILMAATQLDLAGWTTPAVHESKSATILGLSDEGGLEVLSMTKLGRRVR
jgi:SagB-type dehydrogenase family enzyme